MNFNKHGIATLYKEPRLLPFHRGMAFIDELHHLNTDQLVAVTRMTRAMHADTHMTIIGDASLGKSSFIGRPTPEVIRQMEFSRDNNKF